MTSFAWIFWEEIVELVKEEVKEEAVKEVVKEEPILQQDYAYAL